MTARGVVEGTKGIKGKRVVVNVKSSSTDLGELLRFVSKAAQPPADGTLIIDAALDLPQGKQKVLERVSLEGSVRAERVKFTNDAVQDKIDELSRKARAARRMRRSTKSRRRWRRSSRCKNGVFTYQDLSFNVQGASVQARRHAFAAIEGGRSVRRRAAERDGVADADGLQELVAEAVRSVVPEERRRHPIGHHGRRHPGSAEGRPRFRTTLKGQ